VIRKLLHKISSFFTKGKSFVVFEIFRDHLRVIQLKLNSEDNHLVILGVKQYEVSTLFEAAKIISRLKNLRRKKLIVALGPHLGTTIYSSVGLVRENPKADIEEAELENLVSQAIWKFFDRHREAIAKKMNISDLDLVFTDTRIRDIRLDGHKVVNPAGYKARNIRISFSQTFLTRDCSDFIKENLPINNLVFIGEAGTLISNVIIPESPEEEFIVPIVSMNHSDIFLVNDKKTSFWDSLPWGFENILNFISQEFSVSGKVASQMFDLYMADKVSGAFKKRFENLLLEEMGALVSGLTLALKRTKTSVIYIHSRTIFPDFIFSPRFSKRLDHCTHLLPVSPKFISENFGLTVECKNPEHLSRAPAIPFYFFEWQQAPLHEQLEHLAKRQVRWLSPLQSGQRKLVAGKNINQ
jgi:hypothetical protein